jgi:hypothetical protein
VPARHGRRSAGALRWLCNGAAKSKVEAKDYTAENFKKKESIINEDGRLNRETW